MSLSDWANSGRHGNSLGNDRGVATTRALGHLRGARGDGVSPGDADSRGCPLGGVARGGGRLFSVASCGRRLLAACGSGGRRLAAGRRSSDRRFLAGCRSRGGRLLAGGRSGRLLAGCGRGLGCGRRSRSSGGGRTSGVSSRVSDAGASRAGGLDVAVAEIGRDGGGGCSSTSKEIKAESLGLVLETVFDQGTIAIVMLTIGVTVSSNRGGKSANDESSLHPDDCLCMSYCCLLCYNEGTRAGN